MNVNKVFLLSLSLSLQDLQIFITIEQKSEWSSR